VVHADVPSQAWTSQETCMRRLGGALPADVRVHEIGPAPEGFDARFSALWRRYSYRVCDTPATADPLRRRDTVWHFHGSLNLTAMNAAAEALVGEHDFAAFCRRREGATTVRELRLLRWERLDDNTVVAHVIADAFCHNMVRALMGAMLKVGAGVQPPGWPAQVLAGRVRDPRVLVMPPHGLCLEEVRYPPDAELATRATQTRRLRTDPPRPSRS
jgi:tRNA pseudouridine38-40 synthase